MKNMLLGFILLSSAMVYCPYTEQLQSEKDRLEQERQERQERDLAEQMRVNRADESEQARRQAASQGRPSQNPARQLFQ